MFLLSAWPLLNGLALIHAGILLQRQRAAVVSFASTCDIASQVAVIVIVVSQKVRAS